MSMQQAIEAKIAAKVSQFVSIVKSGKSYTEAWAVVMDNSTFGPALRKEVQDRCIAAANAAVAQGLPA